MKEWKYPEILDLNVKFTENLTMLTSGGGCNVENIVNSGKDHIEDFYEENKDCIDGIVGGIIGGIQDFIGQIPKPPKPPWC